MRNLDHISAGQLRRYATEARNLATVDKRVKAQMKFRMMLLSVLAVREADRKDLANT